MKNLKVALQLYSIRDEMKSDMHAALKKVKETGYDYVEFAGYFGKTPEEVKKLLHEHDLTCISVHQPYDTLLDNPDEAIEYMRVIGAKYCAIPALGTDRHKGTVQFTKTVEQFFQIGSALKRSGIQLLYHNHDFEFDTFEGKFLLDWLYETIPSDILKTEIDTCWVKYAGYEPSEYIRKYTGRSPVVHLKDFICQRYPWTISGEDGKRPGREELGFMYKPLGHGIQNIPGILTASVEVGAEFVVVEQDQSTEIPPVEAVKISRMYLKSLGR